MIKDMEGARADLKPGEQAFMAALFLLGGAALWQSLRLWLYLSEPRLASAAALPLAASLLWTLLSLIILIQSPRQTRPANALGRALGYVLPPPLPAMLTGIALYCLALLLNVSFYIATPLFLWGAMCYLMRQNYLKNMLWTALCMGFITLIFKALFNVVLP